MLRAVLFDLMDTVLYDPYREALEAGCGLPLAELMSQRARGAWPAFERGEIDEAAFAAGFYAEPASGRSFDLDAFTHARRAGYRFIEGMRELLVDLDGVVDRWVASNYPVWIRELETRFDFDLLFEGVVTSHHLGVRKPDPEFFDRLLELTGRTASECLFVDDRDDNCAAAADRGMAVHLFSGAPALRAALAEHGLSLPRSSSQRTRAPDAGPRPGPA